MSPDTNSNVTGSAPSFGLGAAPAGREMTYGEKAVGLTFNPGGSEVVNYIKKYYAAIIDLICNAPAHETSTVERTALLDEAIRQAQTAQMWAVKVVTYQY